VTGGGAECAIVHLRGTGLRARALHQPWRLVVPRTKSESIDHHHPLAAQHIGRGSELEREIPASRIAWVGWMKGSRTVLIATHYATHRELPLALEKPIRRCDMLGMGTPISEYYTLIL